MTIESQTTLNPAFVGAELSKARALCSQVSLLSGAVSGTMLEMTAQATPRLANGELKEAAEAFLEATHKLRALASKTWRETHGAAQKLAMDFIAESTDQAIPGVLTLDDERGRSKSLMVSGVDYLHAGAGHWRANLTVNPSPNSSTTEVIYLNKDGKIVWEDSIDY